MCHNLAHPTLSSANEQLSDPQGMPQHYYQAKAQALNRFWAAQSWRATRAPTIQASTTKASSVHTHVPRQPTCCNGLSHHVPLGCLEPAVADAFALGHTNGLYHTTRGQRRLKHTETAARHCWGDVHELKAIPAGARGSTCQVLCAGVTMPGTCDCNAQLCSCIVCAVKSQVLTSLCALQHMHVHATGKLHVKASTKAATVHYGCRPRLCCQARPKTASLQPRGSMHSSQRAKPGPAPL
jgi:hypothetical protein